LVSLSDISCSNVRLHKSQGTLKRAWRKRESTKQRLFTSKTLKSTSLEETLKNTTQSEIQSTDNLTLKPLTMLAGPHTEFGSKPPESSPTTMETTDNKYPGISHLGFHSPSEAAEVSSDEEVNKKEASFDPADSYSWKDPHAEMCSPAQLRQQTTEMYATIDEVLEDSIQRRQSKHVDKANVKSLAAEASR
ncbi:hypothetical protein cypCar_00045020, partial [Cyprinus carpio]